MALSKSPRLFPVGPLSLLSTFRSGFPPCLICSRRAPLPPLWGAGDALGGVRGTGGGGGAGGP